MVLQLQLAEDTHCQMIQRVDGTALIVKDHNQQVEIQPTQWQLLVDHIQLIVKLHKVLNQTYSS